jgi:type VI secretion system protein ImpH
MDSENRTAQSVIDKLFKGEFYKYGFFYAMRLLECAYRDKPRLGQSKHPTEDAVRFGQEVALTFETSTLSFFTESKNGFPPRFVVRFFGLFGTNGSLPLHLTEYVHERIHNHRDYTLARFADLFHHRMICLFYRAWANAQPTVNFDRPETDKFANYVGSLAGLGLDSLHHRDAMPDLAKLHYVGYLASQKKSADGLKAMLADYFQLTVSIEEFIGEWLTIAECDLTRLGDSQEQTNQLGISAVLGSHVWGCQHKFRIRFEKLNLEEYRSLLPNGQQITQLVAIVRNYIGDELNWDVNLVLKKECVPQAKLNGQFSLGWTTWLGERHSEKDAGDLKLNLF